MGDTVYLLPTEYVQNWLYWAYQQRCVNDMEQGRSREALKHVALALGLVPPTEESSFVDPGPVDAASTLAVQGHPMVLKPTVRLFAGRHIMVEEEFPSLGASPRSQIGNNNSKYNYGAHSPMRNTAHQRSSSSHLKLPPKPLSTKNAAMKNGKHGRFSHEPMGSASLNKAHNGSQTNGAADHNSEEPTCLAMPEAFYNTLRSIHGVICQDGYTVSFQKARTQQEGILLQHESHNSQEDRNVIHRRINAEEPTDAPVGGITSRSRDAIPVEYRRKVIAAELPDNSDYAKNIQEQMQNLSLMDKLLFEEEKRRKPNVPVPEIHPIKLLYRLQNSNDLDRREDEQKSATSWQSDGFVLVSQGSAAVNSLMALVRVAAPRSAHEVVRLWTRRLYPYNGVTGKSPSNPVSQSNLEYELVDFEAMIRLDKKRSKPLTLGEWANRNSPSGKDRQFECLLELRSTLDAPWPRKPLELMQRISVGDFVDAQDVAGKWYEARVTEVQEDSIKVHYMGWSSKWDTSLKRWPDSTVSGMANRLLVPMPLWSQAPRWRERVRIGDVVEVRDTSSLVQRPKWYKGVVKKIGKQGDPMRSLEGGADLEYYPLDENAKDDDGKVKELPLLLLDRGQQVLVEVEQEKTDKAGSTIFTKSRSSPVGRDGFDLDSIGSLVAEPPFLRWVNLYGEEICQLGTHLKLDDEVKTPAVLKYDVDIGRKPVEIMRTPSGGAGFMRESLRGAPPAPGSVGLHNLGNSCFLNSTVQCLNHMEPITQFFLRDSYMKELNRQNPLGSGGNVAMAYGNLIKSMWSGDYSVLAPRSLKQTVAAFAPQFDNSYQHDSQEFCQFLMDGLHEDLNRVKKKPYVEELEGFGMDDQKAAMESWRKHLLRHDSIFVDHCQGMHRSHLTCPQCGRESIKFDVFSSISLPLATKKTHSSIQLEDCIERFMEGEQLDEKNAWYCPNCRRHVCALKMIALWSAPDVLILHLKRFQFENCMTSGGMLKSKVDDTVQFPIEGLDLTKYILGPVDPDAPPVYKLFGVSEHAGYTANSGHYTATVRNSVDGQWYRCNDSQVGVTSGEAAVTGGAYLLFYQRTKGTSKWAGMDKVMKEANVNPYGGLQIDGFEQVKSKTRKKKKTSGR